MKFYDQIDWKNFVEVNCFFVNFELFDKIVNFCQLFEEIEIFILSANLKNDFSFLLLKIKF